MTEKTKKSKFDFDWFLRALVVMVVDVIAISVAYFCALWLRYDMHFDQIPVAYINSYITIMPIITSVSVVVFFLMRLYHSIWVYVSLSEIVRVIFAYLVLTIVNLIFIGFNVVEMPRSFYVVGLVISLICTIGIRFAYRFLRQFARQISAKKGSVKNVMIIGAGQAGRTLINEIKTSKHLTDRVRCIIDDNKSKEGRLLEGVKVVGNRDDIPEAAKKYRIDKIIYAIPDSDGITKREILNICSSTGCEVQIIPGIYQLMNGEVSVSKLRKVDIQDLLGRDPIDVNLDEIRLYIKDKVVMVTGGGGSIGSELCRQIAKSNPKTLIIFDIYENNAYDIQQELKRKYPELDLVTLIGSVRNTARLDAVLSEYHPEIVFHAAAHKHVPLMEDSPNEAIKNNVFGTYKMALAASKYGVKKFVLISTDKAVNPTNIMGASKRLCEMVVQMMNRRSETEFVAVRFGNVLGSNGSVIPLFKKQIAEGGPVTVTHPDIIRYFMTIPEAVSLVLQAGYYAKGGEIFVLDMGEPMKIADMARNLIRLSGYEPDVDIKIVYTGLRPGEKLYEELLMEEEGLKTTDNKMIHIGRPIEMDDEKFLEQLKRLEKAYKEEATNMKDIVAEIVPTYTPKK